MKRLLIVLLCLSPPASAGTLSCFAGGQTISFAGIDALDKPGDQAVISGCEWLAPLPRQRTAWPPGLPSLSFTRSLATDWSDSKGFLRYWQWQLDAPLLRLGDIVASASVEASYRRQLHTLDQSVRWNDTTIDSSQALLIDREIASAGLLLDLRNLDSTFSSIWVRRHSDRRPLIFDVNETERLDDVILSGWEVGIRRQQRQPGISLNGQLTLGGGTISDNGFSPEVDDAGEDAKFLRAELELMAQGLIRYRQTFLALEAGLKSEHIHIPTASSDSAVSFSNITDTDYILRLRAGARF